MNVNRNLLCRALAALVLAVFFCGSAGAGEWFIVNYDQSEIMRIDRESVKTSGNIKSFWLSVVYKQQTNGFDYTKTHNSVNCRDMYIGTDYFVSYKKDGASVISTPMDIPYSPVIPGSSGEAMANAVCKNLFKGDPVNKIDANFERFILKQLTAKK